MKSLRRWLKPRWPRRVHAWPRGISLSVAAWFAAAHAVLAAATAPLERFADLGPDGRLVYETDARGNRLPDFSHAGYGGGGVPIPDVPVRVTLSPAEGDDGQRIQAALEHVGRLPPQADGFRGAVLLTRGRFDIAGQLRLTRSGVVLRGSGAGPDGTVLVATGNGRRPLIELRGQNDRQTRGPVRQITAAYVPVNERTLALDSTAGLQPGDTVLVRRPSPTNWIAFMGMAPVPGRPAPTWKSGLMDVVWERRIEGVDGSRVTLDAPLTCALEAEFGGGTVVAYAWPGRLRQVGVENLRCESAWDRANPLDEEHSWMAITLERVEDAWVHEVTAAHFVSSAVSVWESCRRITVMDCASLAPVSELGGYRRHSFYTSGQQTLFLRCRAEQGRHDFAVGWLAPGPNAFVECEARDARDFSGPIESWATGVLYDNLVMDGGGLRFENRELWDNGVGWAAANCVAWQCAAPVIIARQPPGAQNWVIGCWAQFAGDALWRSPNEFVSPKSLYQAQLVERLGAEAARALERREVSLPTEGESLSHRDDQVAEATAAIRNPQSAIRNHLGGLPSASPQPLQITNGWLLADGRLLAGAKRDITWWRGHAQPNRAAEFGPHLTRFVPGRVGPGLTEDLAALAEEMAARGQVSLRHHWGLWYDRRRDDHQMIRRLDADVWPPFFEFPWARSGRGRAWDGLSRYDLTKFNPWYFRRVREFAGWCAQQGLLLIHAMYFQHNILEAGAHWADFPWRPANNVNDTGFPEPPVYAGGKRIFMAEAFYDVTHPHRRNLHRAYIRHCLESLAGEPNVLHVLGEEYSGPLHFMEFWLDTVIEWDEEQRRAQSSAAGQAESRRPASSSNPEERSDLSAAARPPLIGLSAPKDVQDAILADPKRAARIDVIDFKYWWLSPRGLFAPPGGQNLAPRQHERLWKGGRPTDETLAQMAAEYRGRFPDKPVIADFAAARWAWLCAGGSLPNLPPTTDTHLLAAIPRMRPWQADAPARFWALREPGRQVLAYRGAPAGLDLTEESGEFRVFTVDSRTGKLEPLPETVAAGRVVTLPASAREASLVWLTKP